MTTAFRISEADYVAAITLSNRPTQAVGRLFGAAALLLLATAIVGPEGLRVPIWGGLLGGFICFIVIRYVTTPYIARRHYQNYKVMHSEFQVELLSDGIQFNTEDAHSKITWEKMLRWRHNETYILIYLMPKLFYVLPKAVDSKGFDTASLITQLTKKVGQPV
jgi:hypothetical protein